MKYKQVFSNPIWIVISMPCLFLLSCSYSRASERTTECDYYARAAVHQQQQNLQAHCGFKGLRWSNDRMGHARWCTAVRKTISDKERTVRDSMLSACFKRKSLPKIAKNTPNIPSSCRDSSGSYVAVKSINSWYRYKRTKHSPVSNGLITTDFNNDQRADYVFIEKNKKQMVRLIACISHNNTYRRKVTQIAFSGIGDSLSSEGYEILLRGKQLHIRFTYFGHNEGSSVAEGYYAYNKNKQIFVLKDSISQSFGIPMEPDYKELYPIYVPVPPKIL